MFKNCPKCGGTLKSFSPTEYDVGTVPVKWDCTWGTCSKCYYIFGFFASAVRSIERRMMTIEQYHKESANA